MPYRQTRKFEDTCSKTLTLPMKTWAQLYEIAHLQEKTTRQGLVEAIKNEWEFQKDKDKFKALRQLELAKLDNGVNAKIPENLSKIPQIEK